ncbi:MAG: NAD(P)-dependent oxidoreductase [Opitutus sp.]
MKVAVIGASGFIGTRLIEQFHLGGGPTVVAIVRQPSSLALPARFSIETHLADALDVDGMARAMTGCSAVIHAALGDSAQIERMPAALCLAASAADVRRVIYLSSASVHGQNPAKGTDESTLLNQHQQLEYSTARIKAEQKFFAECARHSLVGFALRPGVVYGPRSRWIAELASDLLEQRAWLYEGGRGIFNGIYVDNLITAINCCLQATDDAAGPYLVGDADQVTWEQFYRSAALKLDVPWHSVHQLTRLPEFQRSWQERAASASAHPFVQRLLPLVPPSLKRGAKAVIAASAQTPRIDSWTLRHGPQPRVTRELALLQQCSWKFPHARSEQNLDYRPQVSFAEGMERSFAWWRFSQGQVSFAA